MLQLTVNPEGLKELVGEIKALKLSAPDAMARAMRRATDAGATVLTRELVAVTGIKRKRVLYTQKGNLRIKPRTMRLNDGRVVGVLTTKHVGISLDAFGTRRAKRGQALAFKNGFVQAGKDYNPATAFVGVSPKNKATLVFMRRPGKKYRMMEGANKGRLKEALRVPLVYMTDLIKANPYITDKVQNRMREVYNARIEQIFTRFGGK